MSHQIEPLGHNGNLLLGETFRRTNQTNAYVWASHEESQKGWKKKSFDLHCEYAKRTHNITIIILYTRCLKHPMIKSRCLIFGLTCDGFAEWLFRVSLQKVMLHVVQGLLQEIKWLLVASSNILVLLYGPVSTSGKRCFYNKQNIQDILNPTPLKERLIHVAPEEHNFQGSNSSSLSLQGPSERYTPEKLT